MSDHCNRLWHIWWLAEHRRLPLEIRISAWNAWEACWQAELAGISLEVRP
jgi:hypothetical protein